MDMTIENLQESAQQIASLLNSVIYNGGFRLKFRAMAGPATGSAAEPESETPALVVEFAGADAPLLTQRHGELLRALEHLGTQVLRLEPQEQYLLSFDALNFKALEEQELRLAAETAAARVLETGMPYSFAPTHARERRRMHMIIREIAGVETASLGEGNERYLVVYPEGKTHLPAPVPAMPRRGGERGGDSRSDSRGDRGGRGGRDGRSGGRPGGFRRR